MGFSGGVALQPHRPGPGAGRPHSVSGSAVVVFKFFHHFSTKSPTFSFCSGPTSYVAGPEEEAHTSGPPNQLWRFFQTKWMKISKYVLYRRKLISIPNETHRVATAS